ncbi:hypothetical protein Enr10x_16760 [Gimesia panareensis]|uniref:Uncharacterized protein n=1 Tax=Gimesia panareensis TaxID=2527978 RepID=A0A517Q417_9PLAN|nr:hypothetical protein Enr10x_16760 [Gimesia panareensis]
MYVMNPRQFQMLAMNFKLFITISNLHRHRIARYLRFFLKFKLFINNLKCHEIAAVLCDSKHVLLKY